MNYNELAEMTVCPLFQGRQGKAAPDAGQIYALEDRFFQLVRTARLQVGQIDARSPYVGLTAAYESVRVSAEGSNILALEAHLRADWRDWYGDDFPSTRWTGPDEFGTPCDS